MKLDNSLGQERAITNLPQSSRDAVLPRDETRSDLVQSHHDSTTLNNILSRNGLLERMVVQQSEKPVAIEANCYETRKKISNCATADDLIQGLMQVNQSEHFNSGAGFALFPLDREWLQLVMSHTPHKEGFDYADDYCRFLTELESQLESHGGKMLSQCGVSLFTNTYTDLSYLETDVGQKYYILLSVSPPPGVAEPQIIHQMNQVAKSILVTPL